MELVYILLILLLATRTCGVLAERIGQPALVGELLAGVLLGVLVEQYGKSVPVLGGLTEDEVFQGITDLGVFFLMLLAGVELQPRDIAQASGKSLGVAAGGMALPLGLGVGLGVWFLPDSDYKTAQCFFLGTALAITAVPVAVKILMDLGRLESRVGRTIVSAALFDDVISILLLAVLTGMIQAGEPPSAAGMLTLVGRMALFFIAATAIGWWVLPQLGKLHRRIEAPELEFSMLLVGAFAYAAMAEAAGLHFIIGAFFAGLFFGKPTVDAETYDDVRNKVSGATTGFLAPVFFASIGLHLDLSSVTAAPTFLALLLIAAFIGKMLGSAVPARAAGLTNRESAAVGVGMSARGAVELIVADVALRGGLFDQPDPPPPIVANLFSAVVIMAIVTTLATPVMLRILARDPSEPGATEGPEFD